MKRRVGLAIFLALIATGMTVGVVHGAAILWIRQQLQNVSQTGEVANVALAVGEGAKAVAWWVRGASGDRRGDLILARYGGNGWVTETVTTTLETRWPSLVYSGTQLSVAWVQGRWYDQPTCMEATVWEQDPSGRVRPVIQSVYGADWFRPRLQKGADGMHMVFAATPISTQLGNEDLYYARRPWNSENWSVTVVVTHDQVATGRTGGIFYPDIAVQGNTIHAVWEQRNSTQSPITYTIWYISGTVGDGNPQWGTPMPLSPPDQNGQRPAVAADGNGRVHVVWTDYMTDTEQYVQYRRWEGGAWTAAQRLSGDEPLKVNIIRPTVVWPTVAARGNRVCVAWHGFYPEAVEAMEEIYLRCSADGGTTWGPVMNVSQSPDKLSLFPVVAVGADGAVHLAWEEFQGGSNYFTGYDAMYAQGPSEVRQVFLPLVLRSYR